MGEKAKFEGVTCSPFAPHRHLWSQFLQITCIISVTHNTCREHGTGGRECFVPLKRQCFDWAQLYKRSPRQLTKYLGSFSLSTVEETLTFP